MQHPRIKKNYRFKFKIGDKKVFELRKGGKPLGKNVELIHFDHTHKEIEAYNANEKHLGAYETETFQQYKPPKPGRKLR